VVSQAIFSNKQAETKTRNAELTQQIHADLEDKDIHPISISLNDSFIQQWLEKTLADGGLEESSDTVEETIQPEFERVSDKAHHANSSTATQDVVPPDGIFEGHSVPFFHEREAGEILSTLPDYLDGAKTLDVSNDLSRPPSQTESISSHRSKPDDWRPYDTPNPAWVRDMLLPLFNRDPFVDVAETDPDLRIKRAFHQQDYDRKGAIADHKVLRLCEDLVESLGLSEKLHELRTTIYSVDSDGNGQFDEAEYMTLMKILITTTMDLKKEMLLTTLKNYGSKAEMATGGKRTFARLREHPNFLPWGWCTQERSNSLFYDTIANSIKQSAPSLPAFSFTIMAEEARIAIKKIDDFEERWLRMVPKEPQRREDFKAPLEIARGLAYRFISFGNQKDRHARSDLDMMICFSQILLAGGVLKEKISLSVPVLWEIQEYAFPIIRLIQGFVFILDNISRELGSHDEAHYYTKLNEKLRSYQVTLLAKQLSLQISASDWREHVARKIESYRHATNESLLNSLEPRCKLLASRYYNRICQAQDEAKSQLSKWSVYFEKVEITNWKISRSRRLLGTTSPLLAYDDV
jgi:hypothetical protein